MKTNIDKVFFSDPKKSSSFVDMGIFEYGNPISFVLDTNEYKEVFPGYGEIAFEFIRGDKKKTIQTNNIIINGNQIEINVHKSVYNTSGQGYFRIVIKSEENIKESNIFKYSISGENNSSFGEVIEMPFKRSFNSQSRATPFIETSSAGGAWFDGVGLPSNEEGLDGDYFLEVEVGDIYKKIFGVWERIGNLMGPQGVQGEPGQGTDGKDGINGEDGAKWYDGAGLPPVSLGKDGDYYLVLINADVYKKILNRWERIGNIRGVQGLRGIQGIQGEIGIGIEYNWSGTALGIKREDEENYSYTSLKGDKGDTGAKGDLGYTAFDVTQSDIDEILSMVGDI